MAISAVESIMSQSDVYAMDSGYLGKDDFLVLLITQLQNQDPLEPMDSHEFVAQLAQFSSLEQLQNVNEKLDYVEAYQSALFNGQAVDFIGKTVKATGNAINLADGVADEIRFELGSDASQLYIDVYDSNGAIVTEIAVDDSFSAGEQSYHWDGTDSEGDTVPDGVYTFDIAAVDANGDMVGTKTYTTGTVSSVSYQNSSAYLLAGDLAIELGSVIEVIGN